MGASGLGVTRLSRAAKVVSLDGMKRKCHSLWLDSGAHSLYNLHVIGKAKDQRYVWYASETGKLTPEFRAYLDRYAAFVNKYKAGIDYYANVDAIYNPELSWKALKYLEKEHGLSPVPVIHHRTPLTWIDRHLAAGYTYVGLGGLGQESTKASYYIWADGIYNHLCNNHDRTPCVRTHGFAMTSYDLLLRYPWWSVDSSSVFKCAGFGSVFVPHKRKGVFTFDVAPYVIGFSHRSSAKKDKGKHFTTLSSGAQQVVKDWLTQIGMVVGTVKDGEMVEYGVLSSYNARAVANLKFMDAMCAALPKWPWPFSRKPKRGFFTHEELRR